LRTCRQATPTAPCGAAQFGPDGVVAVITKHEDSIGPVVGVKLAGCEQ
jgi:hypothetical protein